MNSYLLLWLLPVGALLLLLAWSILRPYGRATSSPRILPLEASRRQQVTYFSQIRTALAPADYDFLVGSGRSHLARRLRRERRRVTLSYLVSLRSDFEQALHTIRVVAMLSPDLAATHEFERFRLSVRFYALYYLFLLRLRLGLAGLSQLDRIGGFVGRLCFQIEEAMLEMGERAVLATELASAGNRRGARLG